MMNRMKTFDYINYVIVTILALLMLYPFVNIIAVSFSSYKEYLALPLRIWPGEFTTAVYDELLSHPTLYTSYKNTLLVTSITLVASLMIYILTAYPLSRKNLRLKPAIMTFVIFTMMFNGGLIPNYLLIRGLGLYDTLLALIMVALFGAYNMILMKNFFETIPESLIEAAKIDGASEFFILFRIVVPLSKAIIATIGMFIAVGQWNSFYASMVYTSKSQNWTLMLFLREIIIGTKIQDMVKGTTDELEEALKRPNPVMFQYATLLIVVAPILAVYPFIQKYFVKGMMVGSVKE